VYEPKIKLIEGKTMQNRPDGSGMVAERVGADPCVCPQRRQATIRTNSGPFHDDERQTVLSKKNIKF